MARIADQTHAEWFYDIGPCDCCPLASQCETYSHACEQFRSFVTFGGRQWCTAARDPNPELYAKIFRQTGAAQITAA